MIDSHSRLNFSVHTQAIIEKVDNLSTFSFMKPRQFEQLQPEVGGEVLMSVEIGEQLDWLTKHMGGALAESTPVMISDMPGNQNTRYLDLYYKTDTPHTYIQVKYCTEPNQEELEFYRVDVTKMSIEKELQMLEKYEIK